MFSEKKEKLCNFKYLILLLGFLKLVLKANLDYLTMRYKRLCKLVVFLNI